MRVLHPALKVGKSSVDGVPRHIEPFAIYNSGKELQQIARARALDQHVDM